MSDTYYKALVNTVRAPYLGAQVAWKTPGTRQPTRAEQPLVAFYQYQIKRLLDALQDEKPDLVRSERLARAYPRAVVAVGGPAFKQTRMFTGLPGSPMEPVMVLNVQEPVALTLMRIARELPRAIGQSDTFLENWFAVYGRRSLGWRVSAAQDLPPAARAGLKPLGAGLGVPAAPRPKPAAPTPRPAQRKVTTQALAPAMSNAYGSSATNAGVNFTGGLLNPTFAPTPAPAPAPTPMAPVVTPVVTPIKSQCDKDLYGQAMVFDPAKKPQPGCVRVLKTLPMYKPPPPPVLRTKRGLGSFNPNALATLQAGLSWYYNWGPRPVKDARVPFVPMKAGKWWPSYEELVLDQDPHVLLFNEPNHKEQGDMSPQQAAGQWAAAEDLLYWYPNARLGAPCPANDGKRYMLGGDPYAWMDEYVKALPRGAWAKVAFVTVHPYGNFTQLKATIEKTWAKYKKPIWVTEFAAVGGVRAQTELMRQALPYLDAHPHVERYAWFPASGFAWMSGGEVGPNTLTDVAGKVTPLGRMYMTGGVNPKWTPDAGRRRVAAAAAAVAPANRLKAAEARRKAAAAQQGGTSTAAGGTSTAAQQGGTSTAASDAAAAAQAAQAAAQAAARAAQAAQAAQAAAAAQAAQAATKDETTETMGTAAMGTITAAQLRPVRRMRVYLGLSNIPGSQIDDFAEGKGWGDVAQNISGLWLNAAFSASPTRPGNSWIGEALSHTSGDVFVIQNIGAAFPPEMSAEGKEFRFKKKGSQWETRKHVPGDGFGRDAGTPVASNNVVLNLRAIAKSGYNARVVGATVVTDYICGHNCLTASQRGSDYSEDWEPGDVAIAAAKLAKGLAPEVPGIRPPMYVATRNNWWNPAKGKGVLIQDKLLPIVNSGQGLVYESAPMHFVNENNIPKMKNLLSGFKRAVTWARENNKPLVWLAPKGDTKDYLGTMKRALDLFVLHGCVPDGVVVINYSAAATSGGEFAVLPDNRGGAPVNTLTGVARFLIEEYGIRSSGPGL
jgi:hypothetical protein